MGVTRAVMGPLEERIEMPLDEVIQKDWRKGYGKVGPKRGIGEGRRGEDCEISWGRGGKGRPLKGNSRPVAFSQFNARDRSMVRRSLWKGAKPRMFRPALKRKGKGKGKGARRGIRYNLGPNATIPATRQVNRTIVKQRLGPVVAVGRMNPARISSKFGRNKVVAKGGKGRTSNYRGPGFSSHRTTSKSRSKGSGGMVGDEHGKQDSGIKFGSSGNWNSWSTKRWASTGDKPMNGSNNQSQCWDDAQDHERKTNNQWPAQGGSGRPPSASASARSSGDPLSAEDQRMMKKITIVTQLDKVPKPPLAMQRLTAGKGKMKASLNSGSLSLSNRFGANFGR